MKIGITGHRPERLYGKEEEIIKWLMECIEALLMFYGDLILIDGMAAGVDYMAAIVALEKGVPLYCYFPYKKELKGVQQYFAERAAEVRFICNQYQEECYIKRDRRIVDDCDILLVVWDGKKWGGTYQTYQYAVNRGKKIWIFDWGADLNEI